MTAAAAAPLAYAVRVIPSGDVTRRVARRAQSQAASDLLSALTAQMPLARAHSKSHSRAVVAVAAGGMERLGIDVEWANPERAIAPILSHLEWESPGAVDTDAFYRGWTFAEAYFKAFQERPARQLVAAAMQRGDGTIRLADGLHLFRTRVLGDFQLSLVWRGAEAPVAALIV